MGSFIVIGWLAWAWPGDSWKEGGRKLVWMPEPAALPVVYSVERDPGPGVREQVKRTAQAGVAFMVRGCSGTSEGTS